MVTFFSLSKSLRATVIKIGEFPVRSLVTSRQQWGSVINEFDPTTWPLIAHKLPIGVNLSVNGCCFYVLALRQTGNLVW